MLTWQFALLISLPFTWIAAETIYVSPTGRDFLFCGSKESPCQTISFAVFKAADGAEIRLFDGTYQAFGTMLLTEVFLTRDKAITITSVSKRQESVIILAPTSPGGIFSLALKNITFSDITIKGAGSTFFAVSTYRGTTTLTRVRFENCNAGALLSTYNVHTGVSGNVVATNCTFVQNTGTDFGAVLLSRGIHFFTGCSFDRNSAKSFGGAIANSFSNLTLDQCTFSNNFAPSGGALLTFAAGNTLVNECKFSRNSADQNPGGAILNSFPYSTGATTIQGSFFEDNSASKGGAIFNSDTLVVVGSEFIDNTALYGGAIYTATSILSNCTISDNSATMNGGGAFFCNGESQWNSVVFNCNHAVDYNSVPSSIFTCTNCSTNYCSKLNGPGRWLRNV